MSAARSFESQFRAAGDMLALASASFDIWWFYACQETRDSVAMNSYPHFFSSDSKAHFRNMVVSLYTLYDKRRDTVHVGSLLKEVKAKAPSKHDPIKRRYDLIQNRVNKVKILRNNLFAHQNERLGLIDVYRDAQITGDDCRVLISETLALLNMIATATGISPIIISHFVVGEVAAIMGRIT